MSILFLVGASTVVIGAVASYMVVRGSGVDLNEQAARANDLKKQAENEAKDLRDKAKKKAEESKKTSNEYLKTFNDFIQQIESSIIMKEELVGKKSAKLQDVRDALTREQEEQDNLVEKNNEQHKQIIVNLEKQAKTSREKIKEDAIQTLRVELEDENEQRLKRLEEFYVEYADREARNTVLSALQRLSTPTSNEKRGTQIKITNDQNKPKIIGKGGENIQFLEEQLDNVDIIFNDFPNTVTISHYNLLNRHITKKTLEKLFAHRGDITKDTITQKIEDAKKDTEQELRAIGKEALRRMNIKRVLPDECLQVIGRLQFRTSYGQNIMRHSYEVGIFALMMGYELGLNIDICKISGFLHDLGKAIDQNPDVIGAHDYLTKELMEKFQFPEEEIHAAWTHHDSEPPQTPEAFLIKGADAISAGRPGARAESLDKYIERIRQLEGIATSYEGVDKAFTMSAGRELRTIVSAGSVHDKDMQPLADAIAEEVKRDVAYPGYVRVNVIRTTKFSETAHRI